MTSDFGFEVDRKLPVADQVFQSLRGAIVGLKLLPGASISENYLGKHFNVSRTPVRAAIAKLAEEGLIDVFPQQGSFVSLIRLTEIRDCHFVRKHLELAVLREAAANWAPAKSRAIRVITDSHEEAIMANDVDRAHREDDRFHQAFSGFADRLGVWSAIYTQRARLERFRRLFETYERLPDVAKEHSAIVDALDKGDTEQAAACLEYHLDKNFELLTSERELYGAYVSEH